MAAYGEIPMAAVSRAGRQERELVLRCGLIARDRASLASIGRHIRCSYVRQSAVPFEPITAPLGRDRGGPHLALPPLFSENHVVGVDSVQRM
jgi:hypothetical protein